jgi:hypothetical protein
MFVERKLYVLFVWMPGTSMLVQNAGYRIERWPPIMVIHMHVCQTNEGDFFEPPGSQRDE